MSQALSVTLQLVRSGTGEGGREITSQDYRREFKYSVGVVLRFGRRAWTFGDFRGGGRVWRGKSGAEAELLTECKICLI